MQTACLHAARIALPLSLPSLILHTHSVNTPYTPPHTQISTILGSALPEQRHEGEWIEGAAIWVAVLVVVAVGAGNDYQKDLQFRKLNAAKDAIDVKVVRGGEVKVGVGLRGVGGQVGVKREAWAPEAQHLLAVHLCAISNTGRHCRSKNTTLTPPGRPQHRRRRRRRAAA